MSDQNLLTRWIVRDRRSGRVLGCLPLRFQRKLKHVVIRVSQAVRCPGNQPITPSTQSIHPAPLTAAVSNRPFIAAGFKLGCPNLATHTRAGVIQSAGIARRAAASTCPPNLGTLTVYRSAANAQKACGASSGSCCGHFHYRVRNVVLEIEPRDPRAIQTRLLNALRTLGRPTRIA